MNNIIMNIRKSDIIARLARMEFSLIFALYKIFLEIFSNKFYCCSSSRRNVEGETKDWEEGNKSWINDDK